MDYKLNPTIDPASLATLKAAQMNITIAKPVAGASPNVTWLVFDPFQGNTVEWDEIYGLYASPTPVSANGAVITKMSEQFPAQDGMIYPFNAVEAAGFSGPGFWMRLPSKSLWPALRQGLLI